MPHEPVHSLFRQIARRLPDKVAIDHDGASVAYRELEERADEIAMALLAAGASGPVILLTEDPVTTIAAILGILQAACAFVPFDATAPTERLARMAEDLSSRWLVTEPHLASLAARLVGDSARILCLGGETLPAERIEPWPPASQMSPDHLCYVYFTSGSTGRPKGISGRLKAIDHFIRWEIRELGLGEDVRVSQLTSPTFDAFLRDVFVPLCAGGTVCAPRTRSIVLDPAQLADWIERSGVHVLHCVPSLFRTLLSLRLEPGRFPSLRYVLLSGEPLLPGDVKRWTDVFGDRIELVNLYGPSETTMVKLFYRVQASDRERRTIPIGQPMPGAAALIIDEQGKPCPTGSVGEIYIRTPYRSLGYWQRPDLTEKVFVPNPFTSTPDDIVYRTGDLGRVLEDGNFEFLGRRDQQVKIRGVRVELGEIENLLRLQPEVQDVCVLDREDTTGNRYLCAYVVSENPLDSTALRETLARSLPEAMVPSAFVAMSSLPRTLSGKIDVRALPTAAQALSKERRLVEPRTPVEEVVAGIFSQVLGGVRAGIHDNFFDLGGHSLIAIQVMSRIIVSLGVELPLQSLFEAPTVAELAERAEAALQGDRGIESPPIVPVPRDQKLSLSFAQQRLWFLDQLQPGTSAYNLSTGVRVSGLLDLGALAGAFSEIVRRHESLRTRFVMDDAEPIQAVDPPSAWRPSIVDLTGLDPEAAAGETARLAQWEARQPFDLAGGGLLRAHVLRLGQEEHTLLLTMHHIISDHWSMQIFVQEMGELYAAARQNRPSLLPELPIQYPDFAVWQRGWLQGEALETMLAYWRDKLSGVPTLALPADRPRPKRASSRGGTRFVSFPRELGEQLKTVSREQGSTLFMTLLAALQALLSRYSGQEDFAVGSPVAGRNRQECENLIGFFVNTLVLRADLTGDPTFQELLDRTRATALGAYTHQEVPFERLVEELHPRRDLDNTPLFQVLLVFQNAPERSGSFDALRMAPVAMDKGAANFDLTLFLSESDGRLMGRFEYRADLLDDASLERMSRHLETLLESVAGNVENRLSTLALANDAEIRQVTAEWVGELDERPGELLHETFSRVAQRAPTAVAVSSPEGELTYGELEERSNRLAHALVERGVGRGRTVALLLERGTDQAISLLATLKAGGAFVALDSYFPGARLAQVLNQVEPACLIAASADLDQHWEWLAPLCRQRTQVILLDIAEPANEGLDFGDNCTGWMSLRHHPATGPHVDVEAGDPAYIVFTSGSTGRPKGIVQSHRSFSQFLDWLRRQFSLGPSSRVAQWSTICYDAAYAEIFGALTAGATLYTEPVSTRRDPAAVIQWLRNSRANLFQTVPNFCRQILRALSEGDGAEILPDLERVLLAGEILSPELVREWQRHFPERPRLFNLYGPTESVLATWHEVGPEDAGDRQVPVGRPIDGRQILVFDRSGHPCPVGIPGEIYIRSHHLTSDYLNLPEESVRGFIDDPLGGSVRTYRTGDLGRWRPDGRLEFFGRRDSQVKIRGIRVELEDIEAALAAHPRVEDCAVAVHDFGQGDLRPVGYVVSSESVEELRDFLRQSLPDAMLPAAILPLERIPRTPTGKIDRQALPAPEGRRIAAEEYIAPRTPIERQLAEIWQELLRVDRVGVEDNFFHLGGHSLLATQVINRIKQTWAVEVPLRQLFESPTVAALATEVDAGLGKAQSDAQELSRILQTVQELSEEEVLALLQRKRHQDAQSAL